MNISLSLNNIPYAQDNVILCSCDKCHKKGKFSFILTFYPNSLYSYLLKHCHLLLLPSSYFFHVIPKLPVLSSSG